MVRGLRQVVHHARAAAGAGGARKILLAYLRERAVRAMDATRAGAASQKHVIIYVFVQHILI